jgi:hypothetical protein
MLYFDPLYLMLALPGLILAMIAQAKVKGTFARYSRVASASGYTGAQAAQHMLQSQGIYDVQIEMTKGFLSDHFDPRNNTLRLSPGVYQSNSLSAIGVACHEAGHALQKASNYTPLSLRSALVPITQFGSSFSYIIFFVGLLFRSPMLVNMGILLFSAAVLFALVTLPVEWNASARAKKLMVQSGIVSPAEEAQAGAVLDAAFLTYVAAAVSALLTLLYFLIRAGLLGGRDD